MQQDMAAVLEAEDCPWLLAVGTAPSRDEQRLLTHGPHWLLPVSEQCWLPANEVTLASRLSSHGLLPPPQGLVLCAWVLLKSCQQEGSGATQGCSS